jgi:bifunctional DNase/RNase
MELIGVRLEMPANQPIVLLREQEDRHRLLPIYIGHPEAMAIAHALDGVVPPRPLTHDLIRILLEELGASVTEVIVNDLQDQTFFAELHVDVAGEVHRVSCRPSDAIAVAVRTGAPIFAAEAVLEQAGQEPEPEADAEPAQEILDEFRAFIEDVNPEDFAP